MIKWMVLCCTVLAGCTALPADDRPYFGFTETDANGVLTKERRLYPDDQLVTLTPIGSPITRSAGGFAAGQAAFATFPAPDAVIQLERRFIYFDGKTMHPVTEAVWRQASGIPPFVDAL